MKYEIPEHPWFTENKFPNHSIQNVRVEKIEMFLKGFSEILELESENPMYKGAISDLAQVIRDHYLVVIDQYKKGHTTVEGVPMRLPGSETPLERAINTAWVMNCEFWPSGMMNPNDLERLEYFSYTRLHYPNLYALFIEWAWG